MTVQVSESPVDAQVVSHYILWKREGKNTTNLDVIKLVYLSHGWHLGIYEAPLITEPVEAWPYGPVVPSVYERFKSFGRNPIDIVVQDNSRFLSTQQRLLIDQTLITYKDFESWALSAITHEQGTPWHQIMTKYGTGSIIPNGLIQEHYGSLYREYHARKQ
ncbi:MAG: DUF4065 domain-containing protein [Acidimicrobiaceae bacterium]|nr:DUF4065 domain-containing protein [Bacteroidetes bacterium SB0668_bin_1]MYA98678.1 DUF4065 domain-containing protein [Candidatus Poribacteria bacterium]MYI35015.1 DUF4065 domain-containing protein [Acidimicrobiaceae bacterium]